MLPLVFVAALAATPKLAVPGLKCAEVKPSLVEVFGDHLTQQLSSQGLSVVSASDIASVLGMERQKQLLGCSEDSCLPEMAGALGVDGLVTGSVARVGNSWLVNVRVIGAKDARTLSSYSESVSDEEAIPPALSRAAAHVAGDLLGVSTSTASSRRLFLIPMGIGAASAVGAGIAWGIAGSAHSTLLNTMNAADSFDPVATAQRGSSAATAAYILTGVAVAALATGLLMWLLGGSP